MGSVVYPCIVHGVVEAHASAEKLVFRVYRAVIHYVWFL